MPDPIDQILELVEAEMRRLCEPGTKLVNLDEMEAALHSHRPDQPRTKRADNSTKPPVTRSTTEARLPRATGFFAT